MVRIPTTDELIPVGQLNPPAPVSAYSPPSDLRTGWGSAFGAIAEVSGALALKAREDEDKLARIEAMRALREAQVEETRLLYAQPGDDTEGGVGGYLSTARGRDALDRHQPTLEGVQSVYATRRANLPERAQVYYDEAANAQLIQAHDRIMGHRAQQADVYRQAETDAQIASSLEAGLIAGLHDASVYDASVDDARDLLDLRAAEAGHKGEARERYILEGLSPTHKAYIGTILGSGDIDRAASEYARLAPQMTVQDRAEAAALIQERSDGAYLGEAAAYLAGEGDAPPVRRTPATLGGPPVADAPPAARAGTAAARAEGGDVDLPTYTGPAWVLRGRGAPTPDNQAYMAGLHNAAVAQAPRVEDVRKALSDKLPTLAPHLDQFAVRGKLLIDGVFAERLEAVLAEVVARGGRFRFNGTNQADVLGYRMERGGRTAGVLLNTPHLLGRAADLLIDGLPEDAVAEIGRRFGVNVITPGGYARRGGYKHFDFSLTDRLAPSAGGAGAASVPTPAIDASGLPIPTIAEPGVVYEEPDVVVGGGAEPLSPPTSYDPRGRHQMHGVGRGPDALLQASPFGAVGLIGAESEDAIPAGSAAAFGGEEPPTPEAAALDLRMMEHRLMRVAYADAVLGLSPTESEAMLGRLQQLPPDVRKEALTIATRERELADRAKQERFDAALGAALREIDERRESGRPITSYYDLPAELIERFGADRDKARSRIESYLDLGGDGSGGGGGGGRSRIDPQVAMDAEVEIANLLEDPAGLLTMRNEQIAARFAGRITPARLKEVLSTVRELKTTEPSDTAAAFLRVNETYIPVPVPAFNASSAARNRHREQTNLYSLMLEERFQRARAQAGRPLTVYEKQALASELGSFVTSGDAGSFTAFFAAELGDELAGEDATIVDALKYYKEGLDEQAETLPTRSERKGWRMSNVDLADAMVTAFDFFGEDLVTQAARDHLIAARREWLEVSATDPKTPDFSAFWQMYLQETLD